MNFETDFIAYPRLYSFVHYFGTNTWQKSPPIRINDRLPHAYYRAQLRTARLIVYSEDDELITD